MMQQEQIRLAWNNENRHRVAICDARVAKLKQAVPNCQVDH